MDCGVSTNAKHGHVQRDTVPTAGDPRSLAARGRPSTNGRVTFVSLIWSKFSIMGIAVYAIRLVANWIIFHICCSPNKI